MLLPGGSTIAGSSVRDLRFRQRYNATLLAVRRGRETLRELLGRVVLQPGDVLLLQAPLDDIRGLQSSSDLVLLDELEKDMPTTNRKWVAMAVAALVILLPMFKLLNVMAAVLLAVVVMVATGCLRAGDLQRSIRWDVILLLGSLSCFSVAMQKTGLAQALATDLLHSLHGWPPYAVILVVFVLAQLFTETLSNGATVVLLMPIATAVATGMHLPPKACIFAILFAASQSFLTPIGYQCNLMVFGPGRYRFLDMTRYGAPLTIGLALVVPWLICRHFGSDPHRRLGSRPSGSGGPQPVRSMRRCRRESVKESRSRTMPIRPVIHSGRWSWCSCIQMPPSIRKPRAPMA